MLDPKPFSLQPRLECVLFRPRELRTDSFGGVVKSHQDGGSSARASGFRAEGLGFRVQGFGFKV